MKAGLTLKEALGLGSYQQKYQNLMPSPLEDEDVMRERVEVQNAFQTKRNVLLKVKHLIKN